MIVGMLMRKAALKLAVKVKHRHSFVPVLTAER